ncbi:MAG: molecular chaperone [Erythrobacter sp.]|uniref:molecular chaperone n=1 Tax=Erythrobacter sp. TaxID=1042 RepID=UPI00260A2AAD|nr:molecular chaperone [Erythrobacter sp.]MDJ0978466.1 molecular chaperone [Erythrobacter sp.]
MSFASLRRFASHAAIVAALSTVSLTAPVNAQGDLLVAPTRVVLDGSRGTEIILSNIGAEDATYRIGLELRRMQENGRLVPIVKTEATEAEEAALGMIRYAPRRITLPPGQPQAVRLAARPGPDLPDGEYRVHMSFKAIPKPREVTDEAPSDTSGVAIQLIPIYGVTIPIIVRHGRVQAQVAINQPRVVQTEAGPQLALTMTRAGDSSTYGELRVTKPGVKDPLVVSRGLAIYPELGSRDVLIPLTSEQAASLTGQLRFEYREMPDAGGRLIAAVDAAVG